MSIRFRIKVQYAADTASYIVDRQAPYCAGAPEWPQDHGKHVVFTAEYEDEMNAVVAIVGRARAAAYLSYGDVSAVPLPLPLPAKKRPGAHVTDGDGTLLSITDEHIEAALVELREGIERKIAKHGRTPWTRHLAAGIVLEEWDEFVDALREDDDPESFVKEANDLAVCGLWTIASRIAGAIA